MSGGTSDTVLDCAFVIPNCPNLITSRCGEQPIMTRTGKILLLTTVLWLTLLTAISPQSARAQDLQPPDKVKATRTLRGSFVGFEAGDYMHAEIRKTNRKRVSFFMGQPESLRYFLAANKGKPLLLTYQVVDSYIPEAGGVETIERLVSAKAGTESDAGWWKRIRRTSDVDTLRKRYDKLVEKVTIK
jgi:hypothetical protein